MNISTAKYNGPALDIVFGKGDSELSVRQFPVNPDYVRIRSVYKEGALVELTKEESVALAYAEFNTYIKNIVTNFCKEEQFNSITSESFEDYCNKVSALLINHQNIKGSLLCGIDKDGYIGLPKAHWMCKGRFFALDDDNLGTLNPKAFSMEKKAEVAETAEEGDAGGW